MAESEKFMIETVRLSERAGEMLGGCPSPAWHSPEFAQPFLPAMVAGWELLLRGTFGQVPDGC